MQLKVNGEVRELDEPQTIHEFLAARNLRPQMVVVERNGEIVARERYADTWLNPGDALEIVQMMAGG